MAFERLERFDQVRREGDRSLGGIVEPHEHRLADRDESPGPAGKPAVRRCWRVNDDVPIRVARDWTVTVSPYCVWSR